MQLEDSVISSVGKAKEVDDAITVMAIVARMLNFHIIHQITIQWAEIIFLLGAEIEFFMTYVTKFTFNVQSWHSSKVQNR
jgi:hypothetical protein